MLKKRLLVLSLGLLGCSAFVVFAGNTQSSAMSAVQTAASVPVATVQKPAVVSAPVAPVPSASAMIDSAESPALAHPLYVVLITGFGDTDWDRLVSQDTATSYATPTSASGMGVIVGAAVGYNLNQYFAFEGQFIRYPDTSVNFTPPSDFLDVPTYIDSKTNYYAGMVKVSTPLLYNHIAPFGEAGFAEVERSDSYAGNVTDFRPTFGMGVNYYIAQHWMASLSFNYTPGTDKTTEDASKYYVPYLYSVQTAIAYRI